MGTHISGSLHIMGCGSSRQGHDPIQRGVSAREMNQLESNTRFSKSELELLSRRFYELADMGEVTRETFGEVMSSAGLPQYSKQFVDRVFEVFDADRSDTVSLNELCTGLSVLTRGTPEEKLNLSFNMYDINGDGQISAEEFHVLLSSLEQGMVLIGKKNVSEVIEQFLKDFDINDDEMISLTEFKLAASASPSSAASSSQTRSAPCRAMPRSLLQTPEGEAHARTNQERPAPPGTAKEASLYPETEVTESARSRTTPPTQAPTPPWTATSLPATGAIESVTAREKAYPPTPDPILKTHACQ